MADKHDRITAHFRTGLIKKGYVIKHKAPFVDYRPDIYALKGRECVFVEVEIEESLHSDHTLHQLDLMYLYLKKSKNYKGMLVVPKQVVDQALFLVESTFGDRKIIICIAK